LTRVLQTRITLASGAQTDLNSPFKRGPAYWKVPTDVERPGSAAPDAFAVPPPPPVGDIFDFASGGKPPAAPATPGAAPPLRPPEWERGRPFLSGEFLVQARALPGGSASTLESLRDSAVKHGCLLCPPAAS